MQFAIAQQFTRGPGLPGMLGMGKKNFLRSGSSSSVLSDVSKSLQQLIPGRNSSKGD